MGSEIGSERKKQGLDSSREKGSPGRETMEVLLAPKLTRSSEINWREGGKKKTGISFSCQVFLLLQSEENLPLACTTTMEGRTAPHVHQGAELPLCCCSLSTIREEVKDPRLHSAGWEGPRPAAGTSLLSLSCLHIQP